MPDSLPHSILIVDDDAVSREVMAMTLEMQGYAVASAADGAGALSALRLAAAAGPGGFPDLILMDAQMPGLSGVELMAALRAAGARRVVAISASDPGERVREAADGFLLKPVGPEAVAALFPAVPEAGWGSRTDLAASAEGAGVDRGRDAGVDPAVLAKFRAMMPASSVREIYAATAADMRSRLGALEAAMAAEQGTEVARIAHSIKGSCAMVGMIVARDAAARLETGDRPGTWKAEVAQLHIALEALEVMLASDFSA